MAVEARYFLDGQAQSARFADFVPRKMKYVAIIAACPSVGIGVKALEKRSGKLHKNGRRHGRMQCFLFLEREHRCSIMTN